MMDNKQISDDELMQFYAATAEFTPAAIAAFWFGGGRCGVTYQFVCPLCGGEAWVLASTFNGHKHAECSACGVGFMQ